MKTPKGPNIIPKELYEMAGVDFKTCLPKRMVDSGERVKNEFRRALRIIDEADAVNRYKWYNIFFDLTSEEIERLLYYKGQLCFFCLEDKFYLMPYALDGTIDYYGRFNRVHPVPMASGTDEEDSQKYKEMKKYLSTIKLDVVKAPMDLEDLKLDMLDNSCVLLHDYTKQLSQNIIPRQQVNECFVEAESVILPYMGTALLAGTGIKGMRVNDADSADETKRAAAQIEYSALTKNLFVAMTSKVEFQDLTVGSPLKTEEFLLALQGIDNIRKGALGIENGGIFQKKAHKLQSEQQGNESSVQTVYQDGLACRQHFCNIVNSIWGTSLWCEPAEAVLGQDLNMDGALYDNEDGTAAGADQESYEAQEE